MGRKNRMMKASERTSTQSGGHGQSPEQLTSDKTAVRILAQVPADLREHFLLPSIVRTQWAAQHNFPWHWVKTFTFPLTKDRGSFDRFARWVPAMLSVLSKRSIWAGLAEFHYPRQCQLPSEMILTLFICVQRGVDPELFQCELLACDFGREVIYTEADYDPRRGVAYYLADIRYPSLPAQDACNPNKVSIDPEVSTRAEVLRSMFRSVPDRQGSTRH